MGSTNSRIQYICRGLSQLDGPKVDHLGEDAAQVRQGGVSIQRNDKIFGLRGDPYHIVLVSACGGGYLYSLLLNTTVMLSDMPDAMEPFLLVLIVKPGSSGGKMAMRWGMGARLIIFTTAV